jgi:hypothetical protein
VSSAWFKECSLTTWPTWLVVSLWMIWVAFWRLAALEKTEVAERESAWSRASYVLPLLLVIVLMIGPVAGLSADSGGMDPILDRCRHGDSGIGLYSVGTTSARQELEWKNRDQERPAVGSRRTLSLHPSSHLHGRSPRHTGVGSGHRKSFGISSLRPRLRCVVAQDADRRALADARVR